MMELAREQQKMLDLLRRIWEEQPSLRFCQLVGNCFGRVSGQDIYFVADDDFMTALLSYYIAPPNQEDE